MKTRKQKTNPNAKSTCVLLLPFEAGLNFDLQLYLQLQGPYYQKAVKPIYRIDS